MDPDKYVGVGRALTKERNGISSEYRIAHFKYKPYSPEELVPELRHLQVVFTGTVEDGTWTGIPMGGPQWRPPIAEDFVRSHFDKVIWSRDFRKAVNDRKEAGDETANDLWDVIHLGI